MGGVSIAYFYLSSLECGYHKISILRALISLVKHS